MTDRGAPPTVSVIVPCLNEEQNIALLIDHLDPILQKAEIEAEILIVDDCSDDYTFREAYRLESRFPNVRALHKGLPRGIGNAIRFGIDNARGQVGVVAMGDLVDPVETIPAMVEAIVESGAQLCLVSRYLHEGDAGSIPGSYRFYQACFRMALRLAVGIDIRDSTYAFRAFDLTFVRSLCLKGGGFEISPEMTVRSFYAGARIMQLPGSQGRRIRGESKFAFSRQGWGYAWTLALGGALRLEARRRGSLRPLASIEQTALSR